MHIILLILKIIGITLLAVLGIILLALALILFVPFRYQAGIVREQGFPEGSARVSWLLGLLALQVRFQDKKLSGTLRVLMWTLKRFGEETEKKAENKAGAKSQAEAKKLTGPEEKAEKKVEPEEKAEAEKPAEAKKLVEPEKSAELERPTEPEKSAEPERLTESEKPAEPERLAEPEKQTLMEDESKSEKGKKSAAHTLKDKVLKGIRSRGKKPEKEGSPKEKSREKEPKEKEPTEKKPSLGDRIKALKQRVQDKFNRSLEYISSIPEKAVDFIMLVLEAIAGKAEAVSELADKLEKKADTAAAKYKPLLDSESISYYKWILHRLRILLRHFRIRWIKGFIRFGTGAPDLTGNLAGLLYSMLPASACRYEVDARFDDACFATDTTIKGHIRAWHILWLLILAALRRDTWHMLRKIRKRDGRK